MKDLKKIMIVHDGEESDQSSHRMPQNEDRFQSAVLGRHMRPLGHGLDVGEDGGNVVVDTVNLSSLTRCSLYDGFENCQSINEITYFCDPSIEIFML